MKQRNISRVIEESESNLRLAQSRAVLGLSARRGKTNREIILDRGRVIDFNRCGYLGLDSDERLIQSGKNAMDEYGTVGWSSASSRIRYTLLETLESKLSEVLGGRVVVMSSVSQANSSLLVLAAAGYLFDKKPDVVVFDKRAHVSLANQKPAVAEYCDVLTIEHQDCGALRDLLRSKSVLYVCDGVYSMGGVAPMEQLMQLQSEKGLLLYVDDAHGISIDGRLGRGLIRSCYPDRLPIRTLIVTSLAKGFGAGGAAVICSSDSQEGLVRRYSSGYSFANMLPVAVVGAAVASSDIHLSGEVQELQSELRLRIAVFDELMGIKDQDSRVPIRMLEAGSEHRAIDMTESLLSRGYYVAATFFPTVARGRAKLRVNLCAKHEVADVKALCKSLHEVGVGSDSVRMQLDSNRIATSGRQSAPPIS